MTAEFIPCISNVKDSIPSPTVRSTDLPSKTDERLKTKQCTRTCQCLIGIVDKDVMLV